MHVIFTPLYNIQKQLNNIQTSQKNKRLKIPSQFSQCISFYKIHLHKFLESFHFDEGRESKVRS